MASDNKNLSAHKTQLNVRPSLFFAAFYAAGLVGLIEVLRAPSLHEVAWSQSTGAILLFGGSLIAAAILMLAGRREASCTRLAKASVAAVITLAVLCVVLTFTTLTLPNLSVALGMLGLFFASCSMPFAVYSWVLKYKDLNFKDILLNSSIAYVIYAILLFVSVQVFEQQSLYMCTLFILVGSIALLLPLTHPATKATASASHTSEASPSTEESDTGSPLRFLSSIPFTGLALYAITTGLVLRTSGEAYPLFDIVGACIVIAAVLVFAKVKLKQLSNQRLMFYLFEFGLPAIAVIAFVIKMIPISFSSEWLFQEFMKFYFQILALAAWTYFVGYMKQNSVKLPLMCGLAQITLSVALLVGFLISEIGYPFDTAILGMVTAVFLLFAVATVARNIILSAKGSESASELDKHPLNIDMVCLVISEEYKLSPRETDVLKELAYGHSSSYVAKVLYISNNTARTHMKNIYKKLQINSREDLLEIIRKRQEQSTEN